MKLLIMQSSLASLLGRTILLSTLLVHTVVSNRIPTKMIRYKVSYILQKEAEVS
jgi:hypothetical protein